jgi:hypothetical protein
MWTSFTTFQPRLPLKSGQGKEGTGVDVDGGTTF